METKVHLVEPKALVRSVLNGVAVAAACGFSKVYTREGIEEARTADRKACKGCLVAAGEHVTKGGEVTLHPAEGWTALLERVWKAQEAERPRGFTVTFGTPTTWSFPYAA